MNCTSTYMSIFFLTMYFFLSLLCNDKIEIQWIHCMVYCCKIKLTTQYNTVWLDLNLGSTLLDVICGNEIHNHQLVQNMAVKIVTCKREYNHITLFCITCHGITCIKYKVLGLVYKAFNARSPTYLLDLLCTIPYTKSYISCWKLWIRHWRQLVTGPV